MTTAAGFAARLHAARERTGLSNAELGIARVYAEPVTPDTAGTACTGSPYAHSAEQHRWKLHGYDVLLKDLHQVAGQEVSFGSEHQRFLSTRTDSVAQRLLDSGATLVGASATAEFGTTAYTEPVGAAAPVNPVGPNFMAGGSSGGAAVAVARGIVDVAHATDGGGSIRIPAACCGLVGLKPAHDRFAGGFSPVAQGLLAADMPTTARVYGLSLPSASDLARRSLNIGYTNMPFHSHSAVHPQIAAATASATVLLRTCRYVESVTPAPAPYPVETFEFFSEHLAARCADLPGALTPISDWLRRRGQSVPMDRRHELVGHLTSLADTVAGSWAQFDIVATPMLACPPPMPGAFSSLPPEQNFSAQTAWTPWATLWNLTGWASVTVPLVPAVPFSSGRLKASRWPIALQLGAVEDRVSESELLAIAAEVQRLVCAHFGNEAGGGNGNENSDSVFSAQFYEYFSLTDPGNLNELEIAEPITG